MITTSYSKVIVPTGWTLPTPNAIHFDWRSMQNAERRALSEMIPNNTLLFYPGCIRNGLEIVVEKGKIVAVRENRHARAEEVLDLHGNYLAPGFIDLHVHGALGRDTMEASAEAFRA